MAESFKMFIVSAFRGKEKKKSVNECNSTNLVENYQIKRKNEQEVTKNISTSQWINHYTIEKRIKDIDKFTCEYCPPYLNYRIDQSIRPRCVYARVLVDNLCKVQALVDTGAERMIIGGDVMNAINELRRQKGQQPKLMKESEESIVGFNGAGENVAPQVTTIELQWGKCISYERAIYEPKASGLILDMDYLRFTRPKIDWDERKASTELRGIFVSKACDEDVPTIDVVQLDSE